MVISLKLILCLDERLGMAFNHRRQSRDALLLKDLKAELGGAPLHLLPYSLPLFEELDVDCRVLDSLDTSLAQDAYLFLETTDPKPLEEQIDELILYRWNRHYPADLYCKLDLTAFTLINTKELVGSSHEKITKEILKK